MKKLIASLAICFMFVGIGSSFAEPLQLQMHTWEVGPEISHITYEEPGVMEEKGFMYGIAGSYAYHNIYMLKVEGRYSFGQVDYKNSGTIDDIDNSIFEFRGLGGYDFRMSETSILTPYIGFGYRYLKDDVGGMTSSTGALGYERESKYYYSPIGIETITKLDNGWSLGLTVEYDYFWKGIQKSHLSDVDASISDMENDQNDGYGLRGSIKLQKKSEKIDFIIEPFIKYWDIEKSEVSAITVAGSIWGYGWEPENNSTEFGIKFAVKF